MCGLGKKKKKVIVMVFFWSRERRREVERGCGGWWWSLVEVVGLGGRCGCGLRFEERRRIK